MHRLEQDDKPIGHQLSCKPILCDVTSCAIIAVCAVDAHLRPPSPVGRSALRACAFLGVLGRHIRPNLVWLRERSTSVLVSVLSLSAPAAVGMCFCQAASEP
jgi:hypothetical protein